MLRRISVAGTILFIGILAVGCSTKSDVADSGQQAVEEDVQLADTTGMEDLFSPKKLKKVVIRGCGNTELDLDLREKLRDVLSQTPGLEHAEVSTGIIFIYYFVDLTNFESIKSVLEESGCTVTDFEEPTGMIDYTPTVYRVTFDITGLDCPDCPERATTALNQLAGMLSLELSDSGKAIAFIDGHSIGPRTLKRILEKEGFEMNNVDSKYIGLGGVDPLTQN